MNLVADIIMPLQPPRMLVTRLTDFNTVEEFWSQSTDGVWLLWFLFAQSTTDDKKAVLVTGLMPLMNHYMTGLDEKSTECLAPIKKALEDFTVDKMCLPVVDPNIVAHCAKERCGDKVVHIAKMGVSIASFVCGAPVFVSMSQAWNSIVAIEGSQAAALNRLREKVVATLWYNIKNSP